MKNYASNVQISPDGQHVSYVANDSEGYRQIWLRTIGQQDDRVITSSSKGSLETQYRWSYLPNVLLYTRKKNGRNQHLYAVNTETNVTRCLTPFVVQDNPVTAQILAVSPCNRSEVLINLNQDNSDVHDVYRVNLLTGALTLDEKNPGTVTSWIADIGLNIRAATMTREDGGNAIIYRNYRNRIFGAWRTVVSPSGNSSCTALSVSALSGKLYYLVADEHVHLMSYDLQTEQEAVIYDDKRNQLVTLELNPATFEIETIKFKQRKPSFLTEEAKKDHVLLKSLPGKNLSIVSHNLANDRWIVASYSKRGTDYALFDKTTQQLDPL